ncbi:MAG: flippase-like domain-containing protein [Deltaproteobacteria bacterium]|nr:flippase-like domain-containing protein [Deltaproteobacteria bacterium]
MKKHLQRILPWIVAAGILYFMFQKIPPTDVLSTITHADIPRFIFFAIAYFIAIMMADCLGLKWLLSRFSTKVSFKETILMRGATYLLMVVNYNLAQGGIAFYLRRTHRAPVFKTLGAMFYLTVVDLTLMLTFSVLSIGIHDIAYRGVPLGPLIAKFALLFYAGLFVWIAFWMLIDRPFAKAVQKNKTVAWILERHLFVAFRGSTATDYLKTVLYRLPTLALVIFSIFLWTNAFLSSLPLADIFLYTPIIMIVASLPITPAGLGTGQALSVEFFKTNLQGPLITGGLHSAEELILAGSLLWAMGNFILKILFGFYCLKRKSRSLFEEIKSPPSPSATQPADRFDKGG